MTFHTSQHWLEEKEVENPSGLHTQGNIIQSLKRNRLLTQLHHEQAFENGLKTKGWTEKAAVHDTLGQPDPVGNRVGLARAHRKTGVGAIV